MLQFTVVERALRGSISGESRAFLIRDNWDDYSFKTSLELVWFNREGERIDVGGVKITSKGLKQGYVDLPEEFERLGAEFCSLGQDENYYETLANLPGNDGIEILKGLSDCVFDRSIYIEFKDEPSFGTSLLRSVASRSITTAFAYALAGQARLTPFNFSYRFPGPIEFRKGGMSFNVDPTSSPPTNVHVIIGRNGVGKTRLLTNIAMALCSTKVDENKAESGSVSFLLPTDDAETPEDLGGSDFSNLVTVTFSAFDPFRTPSGRAEVEGDIRYAYLGLKSDGKLKSLIDLKEEFRDGLQKCATGPRHRRWLESIAMLETDPGFAELGLRLLFEGAGGEQAIARMVGIFEDLSSGHKIVLLTMTRLVELVDERTLVLMDEPEAHLHPPLLASFVRAVSVLLRRRNAVSIVATHSPVVLQEVPRDCVWVMRRAGDAIDIDRPEMETFGENVGILTKAVFGLEVTDSGFHKLLSDQADSPFATYEEVLEFFKGKLGGEARAILRGLIQSAP